MDLTRHGTDYSGQWLDRDTVPPCPFTLFEAWLSTALNDGTYEPTAMHLATAKLNGVVSGRMVLLKGFSPEEGFTFFSHYNSPKAQDLQENPHAALTFWWGSANRQIRISGTVKKIAESKSIRYFQSRSRDSQLSAVVSKQSQILESYETLLQAIDNIQQSSPKSIPKPEHWGGYCLKPNSIEFWQGQPNRNHQRVLYKLNENDWDICALYP